MSEYEKFSKKIEIYKLIIDIFSVIIIGVCGVFLSFKANEIAEHQTQVSIMEMNPYFEITACSNDEQQTGYKIRNIGGYIQDANIVLKGIININVNNFGSESFNFVYNSASKHFSNIKDDEILFFFDSNKLGINNWNYDDDIIRNITERLDKENIHATINYIEYMEISYLDLGKNIKSEQYLIGLNENGEYFLYSLPLENKEIEKGRFYESSEKSVYLQDEVVKQLDSTLHGAGRKFDSNLVFVENILNTIQDYIAENS